MQTENLSSTSGQTPQQAPIAFVRQVSRWLADCEMTHLSRVPINAAQAARQHAQYTDTLSELGAVVTWLPHLPEHPDGVFVEDTAVILPEIAIATRPGVASRQPEVDSTAETLATHRTLERIAAPARLDGGDVLCVGRVIYVGLSARTDQAGYESLKRIAEPHGYEVRAVPVRGCLHLKTGVTFIPPDVILYTPAWVEAGAFEGFRRIPIADSEPFAANTLTVGGTTLVSAAYPRTEKKLRACGIETRALDISELQKAEAGLTCLSLIMEA